VKSLSDVRAVMVVARGHLYCCVEREENNLKWTAKPLSASVVKSVAYTDRTVVTKCRTLSILSIIA